MMARCHKPFYFNCGLLARNGRDSSTVGRSNPLSGTIARTTPSKVRGEQEAVAGPRIDEVGTVLDVIDDINRVVDCGCRPEDDAIPAGVA